LQLGVKVTNGNFLSFFENGLLFVGVIVCKHPMVGRVDWDRGETF
jgi:hypothetical protein